MTTDTLNRAQYKNASFDAQTQRNDLNKPRLLLVMMMMMMGMVMDLVQTRQYILVLNISRFILISFVSACSHERKGRTTSLQCQSCYQSVAHPFSSMYFSIASFRFKFGRTSLAVIGTLVIGSRAGFSARTRAMVDLS